MAVHRQTQSGDSVLVALAAVFAFIVFSATPSRAASLFDPAFRFRVLATDHFRIYFHQGEDAQAARLAAIAEQTWTALQQPMAITPPRLTHVVLADQTELANGYTTPVPYDTIVIYATWPRGEEFYTDDWLRLAFTHEFTHVLHLDRSESWAGIVRKVFGRTPLAFPNLLLPTWQIEGIAVYEESAVTGEGRLHAGDFRAIVDEAAREHRLDPVDRVNGGLTDWPAGEGPYAYGSGFHQYLADRFGPATLATLADATARRLPYTGSRAFRQVYGESLGDLWRDYESSIEDRPISPMDRTTRVTRHGFVVNGPRFDRFVCDGCPPEIVYAGSTPHEFPGLYRVRLDGSAPNRMARRYLGWTTAAGPRALYFDQLEVRRNAGLYGDLYTFSRETGRTRQLTSNARLIDPDLSPDGTRLACVQQHPGRRDLVVVTLAGSESNGGERVAAIETLASETATHYNSPRWSPDGRFLAVEHQRLGGQPELVIVDVANRVSHTIASAPSTRFVTPAWRPDGLAIVAAVSTEEAPFNLYEFAIDGSGGRQLTHMTGGALWPDVSPDGRILAFAGYTADGFDVFSMPYPAQSETGPGRLFASGVRDERPSPQRAPQASLPAPRPYSPWPTLAPTSWFPIVQGDSTQLRAGASVDGRDVLGYHSYVLSATWLLSGPDSSSTVARPAASTPDWSVIYEYTRWRPVPFVAASSATSFFAGPPTAAGAPTAVTRRERQIELGAIVPFQHTRVGHTGYASIVRASDDFAPSFEPLNQNRTGIRLGWETTTAHIFGYSISREEGVDVGATVEAIRRGLGASADATMTTVDLRGYVPGLAAHHVVAARLAGGFSTGDASIERTFLLGGALSQVRTLDFGSSAISLLRGFPSNTFAGSRVALANLDYRFPLSPLQRGIGTWPFFLHTLHAAVFVDAGETWTTSVAASKLKTSAGAELASDIVLGYYFPFTVAGGAAWGHDGARLVRDGVTAYVRIGRAF